MVDPLYSQELLRQAVFSVPHGKIHGFGSDLAGDTVTSAWAHADLARDNIAMALADLVEIEYLDLDDAKEIAYDWLFNNPNQFFQAGSAKWTRVFLSRINVTIFVQIGHKCHCEAESNHLTLGLNHKCHL